MLNTRFILDLNHCIKVSRRKSSFKSLKKSKSINEDFNSYFYNLSNKSKLHHGEICKPRLE